MSDLTLLPDVERMLSAWLREQPELVDLVEDRIYTAIPANPVWPLLRLYRIGGIPMLGDPVLWIDAAFIQFDAWGGPKAAAWELAETTRAVLGARFADTQEGGVVANLRFGEFRYEPDSTYTPARPRYLFTATVYVHPGGDTFAS